MPTDPALISAFFHLWETPHPHRHPGDEDPESDYVDQNLTVKVWDAPEEAWSIILDLIEAAPDDRLLAMVGIGPIEDFLSVNARAFIDRIETEMRRSPRFRQAMESVILTPEGDSDGRLSRILGPVDPDPDTRRGQRH